MTTPSGRWKPRGRQASEVPRQRTVPLLSVSKLPIEQRVRPEAEVPERRASRSTAMPAIARAHQGRRAGVASRALAAVIDSVVVLVLLFAAYLALVATRFVLSPQSFSFPSLSLVFAIAGFLSALIGYLTISWATTGRTYGDHVMGLRVVNFRGHRMRWVGAFVRALGCAFFPIGLLWVGVSRENRSLQDVVLRTSVIYDWRDSLPMQEARGRDR